MKKLVVLGAGIFAAGSVVPFGAGAAGSQPVDASAYNVVGEPYGKAVAILKNMGVKTTFGGSRGSALPQAECLVDQQKVNSNGRMVLMLDCTKEAAELAEEAAPDGDPRVGSNGVTTVIATPVGPQPGMPIPPG